MQAYKITLPSGQTFTCISETPEPEIPAAIAERFGVFPISVVPLLRPDK